MIKLVTYPDILHTRSEKMFLICPGEGIEKDLQENILPHVTEPLQIYHTDLEQTTEQLEWVLTVFGLCDTVIVNADNMPENTSVLLGYFLSFDKTYYLTQGNNLLYNRLNANRIYNLDFLKIKHRIEE